MLMSENKEGQMYVSLNIAIDLARYHDDLAFGFKLVLLGFVTRSVYNMNG